MGKREEEDLGEGRAEKKSGRERQAPPFRNLYIRRGWGNRSVDGRATPMTSLVWGQDPKEKSARITESQLWRSDFCDFTATPCVLFFLHPSTQHKVVRPP